jgi:hypothetical protein
MKAKAQLIPCIKVITLNRLLAHAIIDSGCVMGIECNRVGGPKGAKQHLTVYQDTPEAIAEWAKIKERFKL